MKNKKGVVALTSLILISTALLLSGTALVLSNVDLSRTTREFLDLNIAKIYANSCQDEALIKIYKDTNYSGNGNILFNLGSCTYQVAVNGGNPSLRDLTLTGITDNNTYRVTIQANISTSPITLIK